MLVEVYPNIYLSNSTIPDLSFKAALNVGTSHQVIYFSPKELEYYHVPLQKGKPNTPWAQLSVVVNLLQGVIMRHYGEKVLIFDEFCDELAPTVFALYLKLKKKGVLEPSIPEKYWKVLSKKIPNLVAYPTLVSLEVK